MVLEVISLKDGKHLCHCQLPIPMNRFSLRFQKHPSAKENPGSPLLFGGVYIPDPRLDILALIFYTAYSSTPDFFTVVLSTRPFLRSCHSLVQGMPSHSSDPPLLLWEQWGSAVTRWLPIDFNGEYGSRNACGSKLLAIYTEAGVLHNALLDFNPRPIRLGTQSRGEADDEYIFEVFDTETEWSWGGITVKSSLPFRAWVSSRQCEYLNLFLDGNTIIGRRVCFSSFLPHNLAHFPTEV